MPDATETGKKVGIQTYVNAKPGYKKGGRIKAAHGYNTGRENLLEEEGRIKSEPQTKNVKAEEKRVVGEIKKGDKGGGIIKGNKGMGVAK